MFPFNSTGDGRSERQMAEIRKTAGKNGWLDWTLTVQLVDETTATRERKVRVAAEQAENKLQVHGLLELVIGCHACHNGKLRDFVRM